MKGLKISFQDGGAVLVPEATVSDFAATVQNSMVNIATSQGSDPIYPERGTTIMLDALQGKLVSEQAAQHAANFAAVDTLFFVRVQDPTGATHRVSAIDLRVVTFNGQQLQLDAKFTSDEGEEIGTLTTL